MKNFKYTQTRPRLFYLPCLVVLLLKKTLFLLCSFVYSAGFPRVSICLRAQIAALTLFDFSFSTLSISLTDFPKSHLAASEARTGTWEASDIWLDKWEPAGMIPS